VSLGPTVAVTRDEGPQGPLAQALENAGATALAVPTVAICDPSSWRELDACLGELHRFEWLVFTSAHAVEAVWRRPGAPSPRAAIRIGAVGPSTARALEARGVSPAVVPRTRGAIGLAKAMGEIATLDGARVLWPRSAIARPELRQALTEQGAEVVDPVAYRTTPAAGPELEAFKSLLGQGRIDAATFLSPSSARNLAAAMGGDLAALGRGTAVASIGPTTSSTLRDLGAPPDVEAPEQTVESLAAAVIQHLTRTSATGAAR
jgi:uroporphyrinogen-III synthase